MAFKPLKRTLYMQLVYTELGIYTIQSRYIEYYLQAVMTENIGPTPNPCQTKKSKHDNIEP